MEKDRHLLYWMDANPIGATWNKMVLVSPPHMYRVSLKDKFMRRLDLKYTAHQIRINKFKRILMWIGCVLGTLITAFIIATLLNIIGAGLLSIITSFGSGILWMQIGYSYESKFPVHPLWISLPVHILKKHKQLFKAKYKL